MIKAVKALISLIKYILIICILIIVAIILVQRFSNNNMSIAGYRIFTVVTQSMVPKYNIGDVLLVKQTEPSEIKLEDDVTYMGKVGSFADKIVTHQVIEIEKTEDGTLNFHTKGISNEKEDPIVQQSQIYGTVQKKLNIITKLNGIMNNMYGMYFLIFIPLAIIVFSEIKAYKQDVKYEEEDDDYDNKKIDRRAEKRKKRRAKRRKRYE